MRLLYLSLFLFACRPTTGSLVADVDEVVVHARLVGAPSNDAKYKLEIATTAEDTSGGINLFVGEENCKPNSSAEPIPLLADEKRPEVFTTFDSLALVASDQPVGEFCVQIFNADGESVIRQSFIMTKHGG